MRRGTCACLLLWSVAIWGSASAATVLVPAGGDLQAAIDAAPPGTTILLQPGAIYTGSFVVRRAVTIRTDGPLPEARVTPSWSGTLAVLRSPTNAPAISTAPGVRQVRIVGLEIAPNGSTAGTSIEIGSNLETDHARQPHDVVLDRLLVRGDPVRGQKRGLSLHGSDIAVRRSHVSDFKLQGQDTQAIWINNGWGPYAIEDNYLEASGENIMAGGDTPRVDRLVPSDIRIAGNTIVKPLRWKDEPWTVKNLLELKSGRRVIVRGNRFEGSWVSGQVGYGILLTPKDQYGLAPWTTVQDVLVEHNVIAEVAEAIRVLGDDHTHPATRAERITIRNNLIVADRDAHGGAGRCLTVGRAPQRLEFSGNTCIANGPMAIYTYRGGDRTTVAGGVFRRNVFLHNQYGFSGDGATGGGMAALAAHYPDLVFADNLIGGGDAQRYPGNYVVSVDDFKAQFVAYAEGDFRLTPASRTRFVTSDGGRLGADLTALPLAEPWPEPDASPQPESEAPRGAVARPDGAHPPAGDRDGSGVETPPSRVAARRRSALPAVDDLPARGRPAADADDRPLARTSASPEPPPIAGRAWPEAPHEDPTSLPRPWFAVASPPLRDDPSVVSPAVTLTVAAPADALEAGSTVTLAIGTSHLSAALVRVDFYLDGEFVGAAAEAPFSLQWRAPAAGTYRVTAAVIDASGTRTRSAPLDVRVR